MGNMSSNVKFLKGIGDKKAQSLAKLGIYTLRDLICYYPRTYEDRTKTVSIADIKSGETACIIAIIADEPLLSRVKMGMEIVKFRIADDTGSIDVTYFNQSYVRQQLKKSMSYIFYGKVTLDGQRKTMVNPIFEPVSAPHTLTGRIVPVYRLTTGVSQKMLVSAIRRGLDECSYDYPSAIPETVSQKAQLCNASYAFENIHFPSDFNALELARKRLIFEELFVLSCALIQIKNKRALKSGIIVSTPKIERFYKSLPFIATNAQKRAINDCLKDMSSGSAMNRLIQGDVGSGKTIIAAACIWCVYEGGMQSAFMAPTEILVNQHYKTLSELLSPFGLKVVKLTGSMPAKQKRETLSLIKDGEVDLVVGTHALLSECALFHNLALVITDEQHRFGVNQRATLISKGQSPHTLVMSATPIPRTLALIIYGDLNVSVIDESPPGRQKVETYVVGEDMRNRINSFIRKQISEGRQVFIVCPAIDENEDRPQNFKSANEYSMELKNNVFPDLRIACVHGKMKSYEKDNIMNSFVEGEFDILVSTTVIEVGVDIPNASLIIVENAERFGLSQLHQLRGRVGRGKHKSYCILFSESENEIAKSRLKVIEHTSDGFMISEEDLKLRGPGDFFGSRQHGLPEMRIADLCMDLNVLNDAQIAAKELLENDPELNRKENESLRTRILDLFSEKNGTFN